MRYGTGCLRLDGQLVPAFCQDEHGRAGRSYIDGTSGKGVSRNTHAGKGLDCADTSSLVPVVPLWDYSRRIVEFGHQYYGASRDVGSPWGNVPNQDRPGSAVRYGSMQFVSAGLDAALNGLVPMIARGALLFCAQLDWQSETTKALSRFPRLKGSIFNYARANYEKYAGTDMILRRMP